MSICQHPLDSRLRPNLRTFAHLRVKLLVFWKTPSPRLISQHFSASFDIQVDSQFGASLVCIKRGLHSYNNCVPSNVLDAASASDDVRFEVDNCACACKKRDG